MGQRGCERELGKDGGRANYEIVVSWYRIKNFNVQTQTQGCTSQIHVSKTWKSNVGNMNDSNAYLT